jgi:hypothetical protein
VTAHTVADALTHLVKLAVAVHFWAPTAKWMISIANIIDLGRPVENMSLPQQLGEYAAPCGNLYPVGSKKSSSIYAAVTATGIIWSRYATQITPVNYNLLSVNAVMAATGIWHLTRIAKSRFSNNPGPPTPPQAPVSKDLT